MIRRIYNPTLKTFKTLEFHEGLNVLLAEKSEGATSRQTRNGAGKSSMVELVHFLFGTKCPKESIFRSKDLVEHRFGIEFDLRDKVYAVERSGSKPSHFYVGTDKPEGLFETKPGSRIGMKLTKHSEWKELLGDKMFDLPADLPTYSPTFRSLFSYFARRVNDGAFLSPVKIYSEQQEWKQQVALSYLIGLDWRIPSEMEKVRLDENKLKRLRKELKDGLMGTIIGSAASLKTKLTIADHRMRGLQEQIASFKVLPEYENLEQEASRIVVKTAAMSNANLIEEETVLELEQTLASESSSEDVYIQELYLEAGIALPGVAVKRLEDVEMFHSTVVKNRRSHLQGEIDDANDRIRKRREEMERLDRRKQQIMGVLRSHGALEQFTRLQEELNRSQTDVEELRRRYETARK